MKMSDSKLECLRQLNQQIHNLKNRWPIGILSIDDKYEEKLKRLESLLVEIYGPYLK